MQVVKPLVGKTGEVYDATTEKTAPIIPNTLDGANDMTASAYDKAKGAVNYVADKTGEVSHAISENAKGAARSVSDKTSEVAGTIREKAPSALPNALGGANDVTTRAYDKVSGSGDDGNDRGWQYSSSSGVLSSYYSANRGYKATTDCEEGQHYIDCIQPTTYTPPSLPFSLSPPIPPPPRPRRHWGWLRIRQEKCMVVPLMPLIPLYRLVWVLLRG